MTDDRTNYLTPAAQEVIRLLARQKLAEIEGCGGQLDTREAITVVATQAEALRATALKDVAAFNAAADRMAAEATAKGTSLRTFVSSGVTHTACHGIIEAPHILGETRINAADRPRPVRPIRM